MKQLLFFLPVLLTLYTASGCREKEEKHASPLGITDTDNEENAPTTYYDLDQIQEAGELIAVTLSGPETYFEYRGKGFGLQYEMAERFAVSVGARLRMEIAKDTADLIKRLRQNEADLIALELPPDVLKGQDMQQAGVWTGDSASEKSKRQWVIRKDALLLANALNDWYSPDIRRSVINAERQRYSGGSGVKRHLRAPILNRKKGIISSYDQHFIRHSQAIGWDWRLMAAQCYQESGFDPQAISWAGARGLMQIMPETAGHLGIPAGQLHNPEVNIRAAALYLNELQNKFSDVPGRAERLQFVLAAYNGGPGHVRDAMALARKHGKDPHRWAHVSPFILNLSKPAYYNDPVVQYGYLRGTETYNYVVSILQRWERYRGSIGGQAVVTGKSHPGKPRNFKSKVLSAEELEAKYKPDDEKNETPSE